MHKKMVYSLVKIASILDKAGLNKESDVIENILVKLAENTKVTMWGDNFAGMDSNSAMNIDTKMYRPGQPFYSNDPNLQNTPIAMPVFGNDYQTNLQILQNWKQQINTQILAMGEQQKTALYPMIYQAWQRAQQMLQQPKWDQQKLSQ